MSTTRWSADFASQTRITRGTGRLDSNRLTITVLFTSRESTLAALKKAAEMAHGLDAAIRILVPQIVPYPLPLESPQIDLGLNNHRLQTLFHQVTVETWVEVFLCRDLSDCLIQRIESKAIVLVGGKRRWWPTRETRLVQQLVDRGCQALLVNDDATRRAGCQFSGS